MRHLIGLVLTGIGACLLVVGILVPAYLGPRLIQAPANVYEVTTLRGQNATYLDASTGRLRTGASVTATATVRGAPAAGRDGIAVWDSFNWIQDASTGKNVGYSRNRTAFDRRTGELVRCCGANIDGDTQAPMSGIGLLWPLGVSKKTYMLYDFSTRRPWPAKFAGEERVHGMPVYRFVLHIPETTMPGTTPSVPGSMLGLGKDSGTVAVDRRYSADNTYWIDPRTGASLNVQQKVRTELVAKQGGGRLTVADMDLRMPDAEQRSLVATTQDAHRMLGLLTTVLPIAAPIMGLILLVPGIILARRPRRMPQHRTTDEEAATAPA
ncbi:DUF3068 domain-containing protein [Actinomadura sp. 9N407]|uniref:DUF3068 domain-containing protein n=1 Tax=Actinomadura sp. 9N407 TaxID=3375154 RepID=UPI0037A1886D